MKDRVALLKTPRGGDPYLEAFRRRGYRVWMVPVLRFIYENGEELARRLDRPGVYAGLIVTSPRGVEALRRVLDRAPDQTPEQALGPASEEAAGSGDGGGAPVEPDVISPWTSRPFYAAGPETARRARALGFEPVGEEAGSATELAERILADRRPDPQAGRPLLFLAGNRRRDDLPDRLAEARVPMEELVVYRSVSRRSLDWRPPERAGSSRRVRKSDDSTGIRPEGTGEGPIWIVFFSPSGWEAVKRSGGIPFEEHRVAAIGPTTAEALRAAGHAVSAVAEEPAPESLVAAIESATD